MYHITPTGIIEEEMRELSREKAKVTPVVGHRKVAKYQYEISREQGPRY